MTNTDTKQPPSQVPLDLFLRYEVSDRGCFCPWHSPELVAYLRSLPECGVVFHVEETTAAKGPWVVWYPLSAWEAEVERQKAFDELVAKQYVVTEEVKQNRRAAIIERIAKAKQDGDIDTVNELRKELKAYV